MDLLALLRPHQLILLAINVFLAAADTDFGDLGKLMLVGFGLAVAVAVVFTFIRLRLRDKRPGPTAEFISINSFQKKKRSDVD
jgi:hypothetical protein